MAAAAAAAAGCGPLPGMAAVAGVRPMEEAMGAAKVAGGGREPARVRTGAYAVSSVVRWCYCGGVAARGS